jgi:plastocyanin
MQRSVPKTSSLCAREAALWILTVNTRDRSYTMPDWLINIVSVTPADAAIDPEIPAAAFNPTTQEVLEGDNITWSNRTGTPHEVVPVSPAPPSWAESFGVNPIPAHESSNPTYSVIVPLELDATGELKKDDEDKTIPLYGTVTYQCKLHPNEIGYFKIVSVPTPS